jgi:four helix bundle protein
MGIKLQPKGKIDFRTLPSWSMSIQLDYLITPWLRTFPDYESALADQIRRSSNSIASNIAENCSKQNYVKADRNVLVHGLHIAKGELAELESHILMARGRGLLEDDELYQRFSNGIRMIDDDIERLLEENLPHYTAK